MSVWAQAWAYEQRTGSGGAKAVLVALAIFADDVGFCYPSQERLAGMTEQAERTVRLHLAALEAGRFIRRERRRRPDGTYLSDGFHLLAPAERLRPHIPAPDETLRQILPAADIAGGDPAADSAAGQNRVSSSIPANRPAADIAGGDPAADSANGRKLQQPAADSAKPPRPPYTEEVNLTEPSGEVAVAPPARIRTRPHAQGTRDGADDGVAIPADLSPGDEERSQMVTLAIPQQWYFTKWWSIVEHYENKPEDKRTIEKWRWTCRHLISEDWAKELARTQTRSR
jgi:hypothetical protein